MRLLALIISLLCVFSAHAADETFPLRRGVNLSSWLANAPRQPLEERDFAQIKKAGFDHVRLPVNPEYAGFSLQHDGAMDFTAIDRAIAMAQRAALPVILDIHPAAAFKTALEEDEQARKRFTDLWISITQHYAHIPPQALAFQLLNEPAYYGAKRHYQQHTQQLLSAIRCIDPHRLIIISAPHGSSIEGLQKLIPLADANIAYDVHMYEPYMVTHQGSQEGFAKTMLRYFRAVPYPAALAQADATAYAPNASDPKQAQEELTDYIAQQWDALRIAARIQQARDWADKHHVRLYCGEFGVLRTHIDAESRYRWIADTRKALEQQGIGWAIWDYTDIFGITHGAGVASSGNAPTKPARPEKPARIIEPAALIALGLTSTR